MLWQYWVQLRLETEGAISSRSARVSVFGPRSRISTSAFMGRAVSGRKAIAPRMPGRSGARGMWGMLTSGGKAQFYAGERKGGINRWVERAGPADISAGDKGATRIQFGCWFFQRLVIAFPQSPCRARMPSQQTGSSCSNSKFGGDRQMQDWLSAFHGAYQPFPALEIAVKAALTIALGLVVGLEREGSNKDIGARTFAMTALLGMLGALLGTPLLMLCGVAVLILIAFTNLRGLQIAQKLEATTSVALAIIFLLGVLVGQGHLFTPVACSILVAMLLALKPQLRAFAGGLSQQEVRSALLLALLGFVVWPLLPNRFVDPWQLIQPREDWITVVVIACLGFLNYVLLRVYGSKGIYLTAILGGLVNSTATAAELISTLAETDLVELT